MGCTSEPVLSVLSTTNVTCLRRVRTPRIGGVAFVVVVKVHLRRAFRFGRRFWHHHLIRKGGVVETKATAATDIFMSHSPVHSFRIRTVKRMYVHSIARVLPGVICQLLGKHTDDWNNCAQRV